MNVTRLIAIACIFAATSAGWIILGTSTQLRSINFGQRLSGKVEDLYGARLLQGAPTFAVQIPGTEQVRWLMPVQNDIKVSLATDYRKKGLLWYPTYKCSFDGAYTIVNSEDVTQKVRIHFNFPAKGGTYDNFAIMVDGAPLSVPINTHEGVGEIVELPAGATRTFSVRYDTRGLGEWRYQVDPNVGRVQNLTLAVATNFTNYDYPEGGWSATTADKSGGGMMLLWKTTDLITDQDIGVIVPEKLNPGPLTSRITFFAPVCLLFFFILVMTINILYEINIHPMHYLFVAAGFFAFHLLLSYLAGVVNIHVSFIISAIVSVVLVTSYLSAALQGRLPWKVAVAGQLFFLVLFSYSFFLKGITGLTVAIGAVVTLAVLMRVTAHVDWNEVFARKGSNLPVQEAKEATHVVSG
ncbi:inner membrane CreD family protein [bacterium]|nr:inner membrane CreD family protein [bacterium]